MEKKGCFVGFKNMFLKEIKKGSRGGKDDMKLGRRIGLKSLPHLV
jgi:hypothetical protein